MSEQLTKQSKGSEPTERSEGAGERSEPEWVLVCPAPLLQLTTGWPFIKDPETVAEILNIARDSSFFMPRTDAEEDESVLQLIPYCVVWRGREVLRYQRAGTEQRLSGLWSIGVGGHINPADAVGADAYNAGLARELREELGLELSQAENSVVGLLYDDSTPVGRVHLGVVHFVRVTSGVVFKPEQSLQKTDFIHALELRSVAGEYEKWSSVVLDNLM